MSNYCKHLYDESTDGYIHIIKINKDKTVKIYNTTNVAVKEVVEEFIGVANVFVTPNTTYKPERGVNNIRQFRALYIDIDGVEDDQLYTSYKIFELADEGKIPKPTMIVDSGRGIHVYWRIKNAPYGALYTWQELEDMLYHNLKEYGADIKATDGARVLRLPGTINSKNNEECRIIYQDDELEYSMYDLRDKYLKYKKQIGKSIKENKKIITNSFFNSYSLHITRAEDLETLCRLRNYNMKGYRNMALHCYAYWIGIYERDIDVLSERVNVLNNKFIEPAKDSEVKAILRCVPKAIEKFLDYEQGIRAGRDKRVTKGMRDKGGYWYKNETLIERFDIIEAEQKHMKTIIGIRVKYDRNNNRRNKARRNTKGLTAREQQKQDTIKSIQELKAKGLSQSKVSKESGYSIALVKRYWNI